MTRRALLPFTVAVFGVLAACSAPADEDAKKALEKKTFMVSGRVVRDTRTKALEPTNVTMTEVVFDREPAAGPGNAGFFESDIADDGTFRFENVAPGRYIARLVPSPRGSNPVTIVVGQGDVTGVEIVVPLTVTLAGRIEVEGNGLIPRLNVVIGNASVSTTGTARFTIDASEGEHMVTVAGLPNGYSVKSIAYGADDVSSSSIRIAPGEAPRELVIRLGVSSPPPWSRVRGRLTRGGQPAPTPGQTRVILQGINVKDQFEAAVAADGSFDFPRVLPGKYNARLNPEITGLEPVRLTVERENIDRWEIALPRPEVRVRVVVAGGGAPPNFQLIFYDVPLSSMDRSVTANRSIPINAGGMFVTNLPAGEYTRIVPHGLPADYSVKSFTDGGTDILKKPLKVDGKNAKTLVLTLGKKF
jgi:hypothetical protein